MKYIDDLLDQSITLLEESRSGTSPTIFDLMECLAEELDRLDPRDFTPAFRTEFVIDRKMVQVRARSRKLSGSDYDTVSTILKRLKVALHNYAGEGSGVVVRDFAFVTDADLRNIIIRDYRELTVRLLPGGAWKSCVVIAGSILEAILHDALTAIAAIKTQALASPEAPKKNGNVILNISKWNLQSFIRVSANIGVIRPENERTVDQSLRDYRNYVHPKKEIRSAHPCREAQALLAKGALDAVCDHLGS